MAEGLLWGSWSDGRPLMSIQHLTSPWSRPLYGGEGGPAGAGADPFRRPHHEASPAEIAPMVELQTGQQVVLLAGGIEGDAIGPCHRMARQMARPQANHPLFAGAGQQVDVHHSRRAGDRGLAAELRGGGWSESETLAPGHGGRESGSNSLAGGKRASGSGPLSAPGPFRSPVRIPPARPWPQSRWRGPWARRPWAPSPARCAPRRPRPALSRCAVRPSPNRWSCRHRG